MYKVIIAFLFSLQLFAGDGPTPLDEITLTFSGNVDGSDKIVVSALKAEWKHLHWALPKGSVFLNGVEWDPNASLTLNNSGNTQYLKDVVDFKSARLRRIKGRDSVVLETREDAVAITVSDTPNGSADYEFEVVLRKLPTVQTVRFKGQIDGSDELVVTQQGATLKHKHWGYPTNVSINGIPWDFQSKPFLPNSGSTVFLPKHAEFSRARIIWAYGRDLIGLENQTDGIVLRFADNPVGSSDYDVLVALD